MACRILVLQPGIEPTRLQWKHGVLTTGPRGTSLLTLFFLFLSSSSPPTGPMSFTLKYIQSLNTSHPLPCYYWNIVFLLLLSVPQSNLNSDQSNFVKCISNHATPLLNTVHWVPPRINTKVLKVLYMVVWDLQYHLSQLPWLRLLPLSPCALAILVSLQLLQQAKAWDLGSFFFWNTSSRCHMASSLASFRFLLNCHLIYEAFLGHLIYSKNHLYSLPFLFPFLLCFPP